uniref:Uncharacterized protein n=1 Tax=Acrobeloides nanus TaxID=290746 RepID=A0A914ESD4_9BILA
MGAYIIMVTLCTIIAGSETVSTTMLMQGSLAGFYGNIFVVFSIIWRLHQHWSYRMLTSLFIFISHVQVQRSLCSDLTMLTNMCIVVFGVIIEKLMGGAVIRLIA